MDRECIFSINVEHRILDIVHDKVLWTCDIGIHSIDIDDTAANGFIVVDRGDVVLLVEDWCVQVSVHGDNDGLTDNG